MTELVELVATTEFLLVAVACGVLGVAIQAIPKIPSWTIPFVNIVFSCLFMMALNGFTAVNALIGFLAASVATIVYESFKQVFTKIIPATKETTTTTTKTKE